MRPRRGRPCGAAATCCTLLSSRNDGYYHRGPLNDRRIMEGNIRDGNIIKTADECSPLACVRRLSALLLQLFNLYF